MILLGLNIFENLWDENLVVCFLVVQELRRNTHLFFFLANSVDPDQMPHFVASDLGLHCLPSFCLWVPRY